MKDYKAHKEEYDSIFDMRQEISSEIWEAISTARQERDRKLEIEMRYQRYVELAGGDKDLANKFFADAYPDDVHLLLPKEDSAA